MSQTALSNFNYKKLYGKDVVSFHHWDDVTSDNINNVLEESRIMKPARIEIFKVVVEFLEKIGVPYFICDGTALAAYRDNGVMIPHDYDTDISIMECDFKKVAQNLHLIPSYYSCKYKKCEFTETQWLTDDGTEILFSGNGAKKFYFVDTRDYSQLKTVEGVHFFATTDVYTWREIPNDPGYLSQNYRTFEWSIEKRYPEDVLFPLKRYAFEAVQVWGPNDIRKYLEINYGYLGRDAVWNHEKNCYVKRM